MVPRWTLVLHPWPGIASSSSPESEGAWGGGGGPSCRGRVRRGREGRSARFGWAGLAAGRRGAGSGPRGRVGGPGAGSGRGGPAHFLGGLGPRAHSPTQSVAAAGYLSAAPSVRSAWPAGRSRRAIGSRPHPRPRAPGSRALFEVSVPRPVFQPQCLRCARPGSLPGAPATVPCWDTPKHPELRTTRASTDLTAPRPGAGREPPELQGEGTKFELEKLERSGGLEKLSLLGSLVEQTRTRAPGGYRNHSN